MANIKFSAFTQKVVHTDVDFLVGYTGADNVRISPSVIGAGIYLPFSGGTMTGDVVFNDNVKARFGTGLDAYIQHDSTNTEIINATGNLNIKSTATDGDITFYGDNGSGGTVEYFRVDGGTTLINVSIPNGMQFEDNVRIKIGSGSGGDLRIYHNATTNNIEAVNGKLRLIQAEVDGDMSFEADDGSGSITEYFKLDGGWADGTYTYTVWPDNGIITLGAGADVQMYHTGTNSFITNSTGDFTITNNANDADIIFKSDDGSGGTTTYLTIDGGDERVNFAKNAGFADDVKAMFGDGLDLRIYHEGTDSIIQNYTGSIYIDNNADDQDIVFRCDDGSGGLETYFYLDGSAGRNVSNKNFRIIDTKELSLGSSDDLKIKHDATDSYIQNFTGNLEITNNANDKDIILKSDDGSGGLVTYFYLDGSLVNGTSVKGATRFPDASKIYMGSGGDLEIFHNGSQAYIENYTSTMNITQHANDSDILFKCDDGAGGVTTYLTIEGSDEQVQFSKDTKFSDDVKLLIGNSSDLQIYHDASNSFINETGTGNFYLRASDSLYIQRSSDGLEMAQFTGGGGTFLYHNGNYKLGTTSTGTLTTGQMDLAALNTAPASASAAGTLGEIRYTADYIYVCTATNTWKRTALSTW